MLDSDISLLHMKVFGVYTGLGMYIPDALGGEFDDIATIYCAK